MSSLGSNGGRLSPQLTYLHLGMLDLELLIHATTYRIKSFEDAKGNRVQIALATVHAPEPLLFSLRGGEGEEEPKFQRRAENIAN
jgi:hypothetical protein